MKNCSTCKPPPSHQANPTRNGYVPVPPESPVVSVSKNSQFRKSAAESGAPGAINRNVSSEVSKAEGSSHQRRKTKCSPNLLTPVSAPSKEANRSQPPGNSGVYPREAATLRPT